VNRQPKKDKAPNSFGREIMWKKTKGSTIGKGAVEEEKEKEGMEQLNF